MLEHPKKCVQAFSYVSRKHFLVEKFDTNTLLFDSYRASYKISYFQLSAHSRAFEKSHNGYKYTTPIESVIKSRRCSEQLL